MALMRCLIYERGICNFYMEGDVEAPMIFCLSFLPLHPKEKKIQKTFFSVNQKHWGKKKQFFFS